MNKKFTKFLTAAIILGFSIFSATDIFAAPNSTSTSSDICNNSSVAKEVQEAAGCNTANGNELGNTIINIINTIIGVSSIIAVTFIIIGGINYMTSTGEASKVKKAKDTILYAVIGLIICALAFAIVNWVIGII